MGKIKNKIGGILLGIILTCIGVTVLITWNTEIWEFLKITMLTLVSIGLISFGVLIALIKIFE